MAILEASSPLREGCTYPSAAAACVIVCQVQAKCSRRERAWRALTSHSLTTRAINRAYRARIGGLVKFRHRRILTDGRMRTTSLRLRARDRNLPSLEWFLLCFQLALLAAVALAFLEVT